MFPALGFGARIPPNWTISHEFPLNGLPQNPFCDRVEGVIAAYFQSIQSVQLYGPTNFAPVIRKTVGIAKHSEHQKPGQEYFVLLILTDGIISDMEQTKAAIVEAASLPVSIIIVGIGPAEFDAMEELDGDTVRLSSRGRYAERDIVQFVPFRDFLTRGSIAQDLLAREVLAEVPDQLLLYMKNRNFKPKPPRPLRVNDVAPFVGNLTNSNPPYPVN
ncbi:Copine-8 [Exaiptasia diaphana]|nr:Copine-8 [Exaiptasia diaphana]